MNNAYIPDLFEKGMYKTLYALILSLLDELFAHMKINIIGDQILFQLKAGSRDPNSRFYLESTDDLELTKSPPGTSHRLVDQYHRLLLEEQRCRHILENIQRKKEILIEDLSEEEKVLSVSRQPNAVSPLGYTLFLTSIGFLAYCLKLF